MPQLPPYFKFPVIAVLIMAVVKVVFYQSGMDMQEASNYQLFIHMAMIIGVIFFTLQSLDNNPERPQVYIEDVKDGLKAGAIYSLLATALVVIYYNFIDPGFFPEMQDRVYTRSLAEDTEDLTPEEIREKVESFFNLSNWVLATLTGFIALSIVYSLLMGLFMKLLRIVLYRRNN
jgi:Na+/melibiose symporter-like transporter